MLLAPASEPQDIEALLTGERVRLVVYVRGFYPRDTLLRLWEAVEADGASLDILYGLRSSKATEPVDVRGDPQDFLAYFSDEKLILLIVMTKDLGELVGFFWLSDVVPKFRATVNLFVRKKFRGRHAVEAARIFRDYAVHGLGFPTLWGLTPWKHSAVMGRWLGMKTVATLPNFQLIDGAAVDVYILKYEAIDA